MFPYDKEAFDPPAPTIEAEVENSLKVIMQLDSGSDITCIPNKTVSKIPNLGYGSIDIEDFDGHVCTRRTCFLHFSFAGCDFGHIEAVEIGEDFGLFGRDVLNKLKLSLDGPNLTWWAGTRRCKED